MNERADNNESRSVLRRPGHADAGLLRRGSQADGAHRLPADSLAPDEVLRALRAPGIHPVPGLPRRHHQELLPATTTSASPTISSCREAASKLDIISKDIDDWKITFVDTGLNSNVGTAAREGAQVRGDTTRVHGELRRRAHRPAARHALRLVHGRAARLACFLGVKPMASYHVISIEPRRHGHRRQEHRPVPGAHQRRLLHFQEEHLRLHEGWRGTGRAAVPSTDRSSASFIPIHTTGSGPAWTHSRNVPTSTRCSPRAPRLGKCGARDDGSGQARIMLGVSFDQLQRVLFLGAHSDDIEIGCGATRAAADRGAPEARDHVGGASAPRAQGAARRRRAPARSSASIAAAGSSSRISVAAISRSRARPSRNSSRH